MLLTLVFASAAAALCGVVRRRLNRPERSPHSFWQDRVRLTALWNHGAAFGLPIPRPLLTAGAAAGMLDLLFHPRASRLGAGLVLGGGLSNWAERLSLGKVYDYLQFPKAPWKLKNYVYNLADLSIFAGLLVLLFCPRKRK